jgi:hypothetical protein
VASLLSEVIQPTWALFCKLGCIADANWGALLTQTSVNLMIFSPNTTTVTNTASATVTNTASATVTNPHLQHWLSAGW